MKMIKYVYFILLFCSLCGCKKEIAKEYKTLKTEKISTANKSILQVGFGKAEITPECFIDQNSKSYRVFRSHYNLAGYRYGRKALSVHDPLWARSIVLHKDNVTLAIVTLDLIGFQYDDLNTVRSKLPKDLNINYLIINSTHTHHGPDTLGFWGHGLKSKIRKQYLKLITQQIEVALRESIKNLTECDLYIGQKSIKELKLVQDLRPPFIYPDLLTTLQFRKQDKTIGTIIHWECHPESLSHKNTAISSDFPHFARSELEKLTMAPAIYWNGAIGGMLVPSEIIKINEKSYDRGSVEFMEALGKTIGNCSYEISLKAEKIPVENMKVCYEVFQGSISNFLFKAGTFFGLVKRKLLFHRYFTSEIAQIKLGDLTIQTIPGEIFPELVYGPLDPHPFADFPEAKREEPVLSKLINNRFVMVLGLAQDELGYIIPQNGWDQRKPFLGKGKMASYGEEMSPNRKFSRILHEIVEHLHNMTHNE